MCGHGVVGLYIVLGNETTLPKVKKYRVREWPSPANNVMSICDLMESVWIGSFFAFLHSPRKSLDAVACQACSFHQRHQSIPADYKTSAHELPNLHLPKPRKPGRGGVKGRGVDLPTLSKECVSCQICGVPAWLLGTFKFGR